MLAHQLQPGQRLPAGDVVEAVHIGPCTVTVARPAGDVEAVAAAGELVVVYAPSRAAADEAERLTANVARAAGDLAAAIRQDIARIAAERWQDGAEALYVALADPVAALLEASHPPTIEPARSYSVFDVDATIS